MLVRAGHEEHVCFLAGHRAVVADDVAWVPVPGEGGKIVGVEPRRTALVRSDLRGREQILASNLAGLLVVTAPVEPPFRAGLLDRYVVAAGAGGLAAVGVVNKVDQGMPPEVAEALAHRRDAGVELFEVSAHSGAGIEALTARLGTEGAWALVGHSGVGKTSLARALLPGVDVGAIGDLSEHWGTGQHTTTGSRIFSLPSGAELVDSPGIRTFAPGRLEAEQIRRHFPAVCDVACRYRDCLHRPGEDGCDAEARVGAPLLASYRRLLDEMLQLEERRRPGGRRSR